MTHEPTVTTTTFSHVILKGSAYEVGALQGNLIKDIPGFIEFFRSGRDVPQKQDFGKTLLLFRKHCPGVAEEIEGFCDCVKIPPEHIIYYAATCLPAAHCSHLVALPSITQSHHVLVGRNYDFGDSMDDRRLCSTSIEGKYRHLGFSTMFFGRNDGMNEHGLSVTTSSGGIPVGAIQGLRPSLQEGLQFWALARAILEQCKTVEEAVEVFNDLPGCGNPILILADPSGAAVLAEAFGAHKTIQRIDGDGPQQRLIATNHFVSPPMRQCEPTVFAHSRTRYQAIQTFLDQSAPNITVESVKRVLSTPYPMGACCHYYQEFFGTLHSLVFDLNSRRAEIAFGSPAVNGWRTFGFSNDAQPGLFESRLPNDSALPDFWQPVG